MHIDGIPSRLQILTALSIIFRAPEIHCEIRHSPSRQRSHHPVWETAYRGNNGVVDQVLGAGGAQWRGTFPELWALSSELRPNRGQGRRGGKWGEVVRDQENTGAKTHLSQSLGTPVQLLHWVGKWQVIIHKGSNSHSPTQRCSSLAPEPKQLPAAAAFCQQGWFQVSCFAQAVWMIRCLLRVAQPWNPNSPPAAVTLAAPPPAFLGGRRESPDICFPPQSTRHETLGICGVTRQS